MRARRFVSESRVFDASGLDWAAVRPRTGAWTDIARNRRRALRPSHRTKEPPRSGIAAKEMHGLSLILALDYLVLLVELQPGRAPAAAIRWHGRLELESAALTLTESQLALAALADLCAGGRDSVPVLKQLLAPGAADATAARRLTSCGRSSRSGTSRTTTRERC